MAETVSRLARAQLLEKGLKIFSRAYASTPRRRLGIDSPYLLLRVPSRLYRRCSTVLTFPLSTTPPRPCSTTTSTTPLLVLLRKRWRRRAAANTRHPWVHAAPSRTRDAVRRIVSVPRGELATVAGSLRSLARRPAAVRFSATPPVHHSDEAATPPLLACRCASPVAADSAPTLPLLARINLCSNSRYLSGRCRLASHRPPIPVAREAVACSTTSSSSAPMPPSAFALRFRPSPAEVITRSTSQKNFTGL
uniref:Uncharacterized protein n=1 Tax=Oryza glumipatula TaxID=40148 RepID=A0A0D9Y8I8_9ORYZ